MAGGLHPPVEVIIKWTPNYINPVTRGWGVIGAIVVMLTLTYIIVGLRLVSRYLLVRNPGIDDVLIIFNMIPLTGLAVALILSYRLYGFDRHVWDVPPPMLVNARKMMLVLEVLYMVSTVTTKVSILLFFRRLAAGTISKTFLYIVWFAIAFVLLYFVATVVALFLTCVPLTAYWNLADWSWAYEHEGKYICTNEASALVANAIISVIQDFVTCGLPMVLLWNAQIPKKQKIALCAVFSVGIFVCICGILRIIYAARVYYDTYDMTWEGHWAWIWFAVEAHGAVMCASAPALKVYFKKTFNLSFPSKYFRRKRYGAEGTASTEDSWNSVPMKPHVTGKEAWLITSDTEAGMPETGYRERYPR